MVNSNERPKPQFEIGTELPCPTTVAEGGKVVIVGREWGADNKFVRHIALDWVYSVQEPGKLHVSSFDVCEEELIKWRENG